MKQITKAFLLFFMSVLLILIMPLITAGEDFAIYGEINVSYPAHGINCSFGRLYIGQPTYWCWVNFSERNMDHSFFSYEAMDAYYNSSGEGVVIGGETYTLSAYQEPGITISSEPSMLSGIFAFIQGLFL